MNHLSDEELMVLYQKGTEEVFHILYQRHSSKIFGFIKKRVQSDERAQDIFQEVFLKIHKSKHLYNRSFPFLPWIFTITKNSIIDEIRKSKKEQGQVQVDLISLPMPEPEAVPALAQVSECIAELPSGQKRALELRYFEEKTFEEIAETLKTSPGNVRQLISRGVQRLKELVQEREKS